MKINWMKTIGRILIAVGIVGGVESFVFAAHNPGESGYGIAAVAMVLIVVGSFMMEYKQPKKRR